MKINPELSFEWVNGESKDATAVVVMLHGILGQKRNLWGFARRFVKNFPSFRVLLVDLRNHGDSRGFIGPHTLAACASDLNQLFTSLELRPKSIIGHSFGSGVALTYARTFQGELSSLWLLDAIPALDHDHPRKLDRQTDLIFQALESCSALVSKEEFVGCLKAKGITEVVSQWLAMSRPDPVLAREMLNDFLRNYVVDDMNLVRFGTKIHLIKAKLNLDWNGPIISKIQTLNREEKISVFELEGSGHWVHIDNPAGLLEMMAEDFET